MRVDIKKSKNFDNNLNSQRKVKIVNKNLFKITSIINTVAKRKYVPISTRATYNSMKLQKKGKRVTLSSLNYQNVGRSGIDRYNYKKSNSAYKSRSGALIPPGKNKGRFRWFDKSAEDNKKEIEKLNKGVIE